MWNKVLADVPDELLQCAVNEYVRSSAEWLPSAGKLRTRALELGGTDCQTKALTAWSKYSDMEDGYMVELATKNGDKLAVAAIRAMRQHMRYIPDDAEPAEIMAARQRAFIEAYEEIAERVGTLQIGTPNHARINSTGDNE